MGKQHDTGMFEVVEGEGVRVCRAHRETLNDIFRAISESNRGKVSLRYAGLLSVIAGVFGLALWGWTEYRTSAVEANSRKIIKIEADLDYLKIGQAEAREEAKAMRKEMLEEFKRLQEAIRNVP